MIKSSLQIIYFIGIQGQITRQTFVDLIEAFRGGQVSEGKSIQLNQQMLKTRLCLIVYASSYTGIPSIDFFLHPE